MFKNTDDRNLPPELRRNSATLEFHDVLARPFRSVSPNSARSSQENSLVLSLICSHPNSADPISTTGSPCESPTVLLQPRGLLVYPRRCRHLLFDKQDNRADLA